MTMMAETYVLQALQTGLSAIRSSPDLLSGILTALNDNEMTAAKQWFGNGQNKINIAPGFPSEPTHLPFIGVTVGEENQITEQTGIGLEYFYDGTENIRGARFRGTIKATIYTQDANLIVWLSAVAKWSLLSQYDWLGEQAGFNNIGIGMGDYEPQPDFLPGFTFARGIFVTAEYEQTFSEVPQNVTSFQLQGNYSTYEEE